MKLRHLEEAEQHVAEGAAHIEHQRQIIAILERDGHDTTDAEAILKTFLETQALHEEGLAKVRAELEQG